MTQEAAVDIQKFIDTQKFGPYQMMVVGLCAMVVMMDGFDTQAIGYVAPAIIKSWHISRSALSPVFSAGLFGLMIGALSFGPVADRFGRKPVLVVCTLFFGIFSFLTATADSMQSLLVFRFLTGLGLGGALPNTIAMTSEYAPARIRHTVTMLMFAGFSIGAALGGVAAASLISRFGWQSVFVLGGIMPAVGFLVVLVLAPESLRFLAHKGGRNEKIIAILAKVAPGVRLDPRTVFIADEHKSEGFPVAHLFTNGRALLTLLLWIVFFMSLFDMYFLSSWLPTVIHDSGVAVNYAILITAMFQVGGSVGPLILGRLFDRFSPFRVLSLTYVGASVMIYLIGSAGTSVEMLFVTVFGAGIFLVGAQGGANALSAGLYPTSVRSTGIGWALGIGRIGSIIGPIIGGVLLSRHWDTKQVFMVGAVPVACAAISALLISLLASQRKTASSPLLDLSQEPVPLE